MQIRLSIALLSAFILSGCFSQPPTADEVAQLVQKRWNSYPDYKISKVRITDLNCANREGKYLCEFTEDIEGTTKKFKMENLKTYILDVPYARKGKSSISVSKGDKGWIVERF